MDKISGAFWNANEYRLRTLWRILLHALATAACFISFVLFVTFVFKPDTSNPSFMAFGAVSQQVIVLACVFLACLWLDWRNFRDLGLKINRRWWIDLVGGLALGSALMAIIFLIEYLLGWVTIEESYLDQGRFGEFFILQTGWLIAMICVGTVEEIMSRGYHLKNLTEGFKKLGFLQSFLLASLISSSVFGILHMMNPNATIIGTVGVFLAGIMFCIGRLFTGSLAAPIGMHIAWNYAQGAVFGFPVSGVTFEGSIIKMDQAVDSIWTGGKFGPEAGLMGLFAIVTACLVFIFWPATKTGWKENLLELIRFRRRVLAPKAKPSPTPSQLPSLEEKDS